MAQPDQLPADGPQVEQRASALPDDGVVLIIPSLGAPTLAHCLRTVADLDPSPDRTVVVLSGAADPPPEAATVEVLRIPHRLGFATAFNVALGKACGPAGRIAVLNDDALPPPGWLDELGGRLDADSSLAAVQGTITNDTGQLVDGRGIALDRYGLPVQVDRGQPFSADTEDSRRVVAVSGTAALYRTTALEQAAIGTDTVFDPIFGSYHEDLDLGLRLRRLGWRAAWVGGGATRHLGSETGRRLRWRHPWWLLANRWRALAGNLTPSAFVRALPLLLRGELRAVRTLVRSNPRTAPVALGVLMSLPVLVAGAWRRRTPGARLTSLPEVP
jgi:GT2 family glycosyltransferase